MLAAAALEEMREALHLHNAALYLPDADGTRSCAATSATTSREELSFDEEAWRLAVAAGAPIVLREAASLAGREPVRAAREQLGDPPAGHGRREMVGVVIASAAEPIRIDPLSGTVLSLLGLQLSAGITTARLRRELLDAAMERERRPLAAEVHDGLAQYLARRAARARAAESPTAQRLTEAVDAAHRLVRARLQVLSGDAPADLREAIEAAASAREPNVRVCGRGEAGPEAVTLAARVVSEALANADAHAHARSVEIDLRRRRRAARADRRRRRRRLRPRTRPRRRGRPPRPDRDARARTRPRRRCEITSTPAPEHSSPYGFRSRKRFSPAGHARTSRCCCRPQRRSRRRSRPSTRSAPSATAGCSTARSRAAPTPTAPRLTAAGLDVAGSRPRAGWSSPRSSSTSRVED